MLPFMEGHDLFDRIEFGESWDSVTHAPLRATAANGMQCHSLENGSGDTHIFAVTSPNSMWQDRKLSLDDIADGPSQTLMLIELDLPGINWMSTIDVTLDQLLAMLSDKGRLPGPHPDVVLMAFADGHVSAIPDDVITPELLRALVSIDGGEEISDDLERNAK